MIMRAWQRIPILVRALLTGLGVQLLGVVPFSILVQINLTTSPSIPWAVPVELLLLWGLFRYLRGDGPPHSTGAVRRRWLRACPPRGHIGAVTIAGAMLGMTVASLVILGYSLIEVPEGALGLIAVLPELPLITAVALALTLALMTGVVEEAAFRGYMQVPIEERHGTVPAVLTVAIVFALAHQPALVILPLYVIGAVGWGILARVTRSTIPGMIVHGLVDAVFLLWLVARPDQVQSLLAEGSLAGGDATRSIVAGLSALTFGGLAMMSFVWIRRGSDPRSELIPGRPIASPRR